MPAAPRATLEAATPCEHPPGTWRSRHWRALEAAGPRATVRLTVPAEDLADARAWLAWNARWADLRAGRARPSDEATRGALALAARDEAFARLVGASCAPHVPQRASTFATLARAIAYQQLSGKAAATIWGRVVEAVGGSEPTAEALLKRRAPTLRKAGLSAAKVAAVQDLARHVRRGAIVPERLPELGDEEVVERLTQVRGIGRWSAQMHLMFSLGRLDVWPSGDLGVRKGFARWRGLAREPVERELEPLGEPYRPYRSLAAWYAWRALDVGFP